MRHFFPTLALENRPIWADPPASGHSEPGLSNIEVAQNTTGKFREKPEKTKQTKEQQINKNATRRI